MALSFITGIVLLAFGGAFLFSGVIAITFRDSDKQDTPSIPYMILGIFTSLNYLLDFIKNLIDAPSKWRDMKMELALLGVGTALSVVGFVLLIR